MGDYSIEKLNELYDFEFDKVIREIKSSKAKLVLLQFPDGLKQYATAVVDYLEEKTSAKFIIWLGTCYGACDIPVGIDKLTPKIDLMIQFGHSNLMPSYLRE